uniref:Uncharacterized protein n=1 Tax=Tanacetum cinerariifolium TaxID=118510 RepID=A0A6L2M166_TANCI|nr:hypothetical protein [Tanacetum cinerariifolium]
MEEVSLNINEAKLKKITDEMLRQRCSSGDEHQYHIDQMKNFLKSDILWESQKEILVSSHPQKTTLLVLSCQRDLKAPVLCLINQYLLYLKKGNSEPEKIVLSLHKFPIVVFNDDDIEEQTSRWIIARRANECIVSITKPDFKNLNKNDVDDMYLQIMNGKSYNNDVKYGYTQRDLTKDEVERLKLFEEDIEVRLKYRRQMRRWESYVNRRPLGLQRERPE